MRPTNQSSHEFALVDGIRVDVAALLRLAHACEPSRCERASSCCSSYEVLVDRKEQRQITGYLDEASHYAAGLAEDGGFIEPFEATEGAKCLTTHEDGLCVFAFGNRQARVLCSLHAVALERGLKPHTVKPLACAIWPLYFVESDPPLLTVQEGAMGFPCNTPRARSSGARRLHPGVADILRSVWGETFLERVAEALSQR